MKELSDCKTPHLFIKKVRSETEDEAVIQVNSSEQAMVFLAMQYGEFVEVLEPENIRDRIKENISEMTKKYMV